MRVNTSVNKFISALLCLCMLAQNVPVMAFAAAGDNLCAHHAEHTAQCGYAQGSAGSVCTHEHTEQCRQTTQDCTHTHGSDGCTYVPGREEVSCGHVCSTELCGYVAPGEGTSCECVPGEDGTVNHAEGCGYVAPDEGTPCGFVHEDCGCAAAVEPTGECGHSCSRESGCEKTVNTCGHTDDGSCCYVQAVEPHDCHYECPDCESTGDGNTAQDVTDEAVCDCGTDEPAVHATNCAVYTAPENPECFCTEKCTEVNVWCDICGFDISRCGGEDTAVTYACSHTDVLSLQHEYGSDKISGRIVDGDPSTHWYNYHPKSYTSYEVFSTVGPTVLKSYTLTVVIKNAEFNWTSWTLYGSHNKNEDWVEINQVVDTTLVVDSNNVSQMFMVEPHTAYPYYKLVPNDIATNDLNEYHRMAEFTITGYCFNNGTCTKCGYSHSEHSYTNGFCDVCLLEHDHTTENFTDGECAICHYICPHKAYDANRNCSVCGSACANAEFENSICKACGYECDHTTAGYEAGFCKLCGTEHDHDNEGYINGVRPECGYRCSHEAVLKLNLIDGSDNNVLGLVDGDLDTQWGGTFKGDGTSWIIFTAGDSALLKSYKLTTSKIADIAPWYTWKSWTIYGRNDEEEWTKIHWVKDAQLPEVPNVATDAYVPYISYPYDQFKLVVNAIASGSSNSLQYMSDITVTGFLFKDGSCSECGYICQSHTYSGGICTVCGFGCPHESFDGIVCTNCLFACPHAQFGTDSKCTMCKSDCPHASGYDKNDCCKDCGTPCDHQKGYSDTGFCKSCDQVEPAPLVEGVYKISKAGHLYWFADQVNTGQPDKTNINGELTCNIDLKANTPTDGNWSSMGSTERPYQGTLDGKGYTVDNVKIWEEEHVGFIRAIGTNGVVRNLGLGQQCSISGYTITGGICGKNDGLIEGCWYSGKIMDRGKEGNSAYIGGTAGGIAGENNRTIINCWFDGQLNEGGDEGYRPSNDGGIVGDNSGGTVENCYNMGTVYGWACYGGIVGTGGTVKHCYTLMPVKKFSGDTNCEWPHGIGGYATNSYHAKTDENQPDGIPRSTFSTGELAYKLQQGTGSDELIWGQNLDNGKPRDDYPTLAYHGAPRVYQFTNCVKDVIYSNTERENGAHWPVVNGMCPCSEQADAPEQENGVYLISNAGELLWFARKCNEQTGYARLNARLTADIVVNENAFSGKPAIAWPVIRNFVGDFNGDGHTISGLYVAQTDGESAGMFDYVQASGSFDGTIRNLSVVDSYISGIGAVGGIVGNLATSGKVENCSFTGKVVCTGGVTAQNGEYYEYAGGLVGRNNGTVQNSYANASVSCPDETGAYAGGVVGYNRYSKPQNCYYNSTKFKGYPSGNDTYNGESTFDEAYLENIPESKTEAQFASGEVAYLMQRYYEEKMNGKDLLWGQTIGTNAYPKLGGAKVYAIKDCQDKISYSNTNIYGRHEYGSDGMCACGAYYTALLEVDLSWGEMAFTYTEGSWNPQTHTYEEGGWTADTDGGNQISVTNQGNVPVKVNLSYEADDDHTGIRGTFTDSAGNDLVEAVYLEKRKSDTYGLTLSGAPDQSLHGDGLGTVTVAISNGWQVGDTVSHVAKNGVTYTCYVAVVSEDNVVLVGRDEFGASPDAVQTKLDEMGARAPDKNKPEFEAFIKPRIQNGTYFTSSWTPAYIVDNDSIYRLYCDDNTGELIGKYGPSEYSYKLIPVWDVPIP